jgi:DNA-binding transcriptional ArsR family regulator
MVDKVYTDIVNLIEHNSTKYPFGISVKDVALEGDMAKQTASKRLAVCLALGLIDMHKVGTNKMYTPKKCLKTK